MKNILYKAWILHLRAYRDKDLLVDVFTRDFGKFRAVLHGARQLRSGRQNRNTVQIGQFLLLSWSGRTELKTLKNIELEGSYRHYPPYRLLTILYLNELLYRLFLDWDCYPRVFDAYGECLSHILTDDQNQVHIALRCFELLLLSELGYSIDFSYSDSLVDDADYCYRLEEGFVPIHAVMAKSVNNKRLSTDHKPSHNNQYNPTSQYHSPESNIDTLADRAIKLPPREINKDTPLFKGALIKAMANQYWHLPKVLSTVRLLTRIVLTHISAERPLLSYSLLKPVINR